MRVQEDWDRPRGGGSYYPPLRFPDALEKPAGEDPRLPGTLGGLGRPPAPAGGFAGTAEAGAGSAGFQTSGGSGAFGGGGGAFGSGAFGGGAFGNGAFGGGAFGGSSSSTNGCAGRNGAFDSATAGTGGLPPTPAGPSAGLRSPGGDMSSGLHTSAGNANGRPAGAMVNSTFTVLQRETSSSLASNGLNYSSGGACASSKMSQRHDPFASTDAPSGNGCMSQGPGGHDRYAHAGISGGAFSDSSAGVPRGSVREDDRAPVAPSAFDDRDGRYGASVQRYSPHENGSRDGFAAGPGGAPRSEPSGSSYGAFGSSMGGGGLPNGRSALDSGVAASAAPNGSAGFRGYDAGSQDRGAAGTSAASYAGRDVDDGFGAPFGRSAASPEPLRPALADPLPPRPPGGRAPEEAVGGAPLEQEVEVRASGTVPGRWRSWDDVGFPARVRSPLITAGFPAPTLIQQYAWPICFLGRDLIGIAKTGSGKTLAFLLPAFARLLNSHADPRGPPAILVMAPTRELACQIEQEAKQFGEMAGMRATCLYGGAPKGPQLAELRGRPQVLVATPGRLNDLLEPPAGLSVAVDIKGIQYLVLDEADRMLDMGFEPQIRKIIRGLPQERQTLMFTATWPAAVRRLAMEFMREAVEVRVGEADELRVNPDVEQSVIICSDYREKEDRLVSILREGGDDQAIIFVNTKRMCESVALRTDNSVVIHGDKDQRERDQALGLFKSGSRRILVATDVAARGLDIKSVRLVVNFDPPNREEDYVHRVGRTGRAGLKGRAITLLTNDDGGAARSIVEIYKRMGLPVPEELERRLASGEMRQGGGRGGRDGGGRDGPRRLGGGLGGGRRGLGGDMGFGDDDFDNMGGSRFSGGFGAGRRDDDFPGFCLNDCPT